MYVQMAGDVSHISPRYSLLCESHLILTSFICIRENVTILQEIQSGRGKEPEEEEETNAYRLRYIHFDSKILEQSAELEGAALIHMSMRRGREIYCSISIRTNQLILYSLLSVCLCICTGVQVYGCETRNAFRQHSAIRCLKLDLCLMQKNRRQATN